MRSLEDIIKMAYAKLRMKGEVEGSPDFNFIKSRYKWRRNQGYPVGDCLWAAVRAKAGSKWYSPPSLGKADEQGHRCVSGYIAFGLRFVNYSDKIIDGRNSHEGWYTTYDGHNGETYRGCVFRLPGRDKHTRYLAGYRDVAGDCYVIDFSKVYTSIPDDHPRNYDNFLYDAARAGDRMAEKDAEECREHDYKHMKATEWAELCDQISDVRCDCPAAATERDRLREKIEEIEGEFLDIAEFAENNL